MQTKEEIAKTILYLPVTNGKSEESIAFGANLIEQYANQQISALQTKLSETTKLLEEEESNCEHYQDRCILLDAENKHLQATIECLNGIIDTQKKTEDILLEKIKLGEARIKELEDEVRYVKSLGYDQLSGELDYIRNVDIPAAESELQDALCCLNSLMDLLHEKLHPAEYLVFESKQFADAESLIRARYTPPKREVSDEDLPF
ncbi:MAG: hypothetical protein ACTHJ2_10690 [Candidatus Nitrosocosmicus sp.]